MTTAAVLIIGDEVLSGGFVLSGSGYCEATAVRDDSYAGQIAGEAKAFRHAPSPLQHEVNRVIVACTWVLVPLAIVLYDIPVTGTMSLVLVVLGLGTFGFVTLGTFYASMASRSRAREVLLPLLQVSLPLHLR